MGVIFCSIFSLKIKEKTHGKGRSLTFQNFFTPSQPRRVSKLGLTGFGIFLAQKYFRGDLMRETKCFQPAVLK